MTISFVVNDLGLCLKKTVTGTSRDIVGLGLGLGLGTKTYK